MAQLPTPEQLARESVSAGSPDATLALCLAIAHQRGEALSLAEKGVLDLLAVAGAMFVHGSITGNPPLLSDLFEVLRFTGGRHYTPDHLAATMRLYIATLADEYKPH